jgi:Serine dehydrogenase proteinase
MNMPLKATVAQGDGGAAAAAAPPAKPPDYTASVHTGPGRALPADFVAAVQALEKTLKTQVWLLVHNDEGKLGDLGDELVEAMLAAKGDMPMQEPIALLIDSPGGFAKCAYQIASLLKACCGGFTAVVPRCAKSAATLLALGADTILLGRHAELGPLDAQYHDPEREEWVSALDEVQALERLHAFSLEAFDRTMFLLTPRTRKKVETLLPLVLDYIAKMMLPLFEKIDAVHYTQVSRSLKVAEEYAIRLLQAKYQRKKAEEIARRLVSYYPEHGFVIDGAEAAAFGLETTFGTPEQQKIMDSMRVDLTRVTAIGRLVEVPAK